MEENQNLEQVEQTEEVSPALEGIQALEQEPQEAPQPEQPQANDNVRALRLAKQQAERERDEAMRLIAEFKQQQQAMHKPQEPEEDLSVNLNPDDYAEGKHLLKMSRRMQKMESEYRERMQQFENQSRALAAESQLRMQYPDIDKVINAENIALLRDEYPELAATINSNQDTYSKSVAAYTMIKKLGIHKDAVVNDAQNRIVQNSQKPRSSASVSPQRAESPLNHAHGFANGLTKEAKEQAARELAEIIGY